MDHKLLPAEPQKSQKWVKHGFVLGCFGNMKLSQTKNYGLKSLRASLVKSDKHEMTVNPQIG